MIQFIQDDRGNKLVEVANVALEHAITTCGPGRPFKGIGKAIHDFIHDKHYSVSNLFMGHGIGRVFHSAPWIHHRCLLLLWTCLNPDSNYCSERRTWYHGTRTLFHHRGSQLVVFRINLSTYSPPKPAIIQGSNPEGWIFPDGWTASTMVCLLLIQSRGQKLTEQPHRTVHDLLAQNI